MITVIDAKPEIYCSSQLVNFRDKEANKEQIAENQKKYTLQSKACSQL